MIRPFSLDTGASWGREDECSAPGAGGADQTAAAVNEDTGHDPLVTSSHAVASNPDGAESRGTRTIDGKSKDATTEQAWQ